MNSASERALLGAILERPGFFRQIEGISADHFMLSSHRAIFRAMAQLDADGKPIEPGLVCDCLNGNLQSVGGIAYVIGLIDGCVPESAPYHVEIIRRDHDE